MTPKKKQEKGPRRYRMTRRGRLSSARATRWVEKYTGKNIIKGYSNWFAVDPLSAVAELRALGVSISQEREMQIRDSIETRAVARRLRRKSAAETEGKGLRSDSDNTFAYIAGYTQGGVPYGITWEELGEKPPSFDEE
jgi:hypothetical protein